MLPFFYLHDICLLEMKIKKSEQFVPKIVLFTTKGTKKNNL